MPIYNTDRSPRNFTPHCALPEVDAMTVQMTLDEFGAGIPADAVGDGSTVDLDRISMPTKAKSMAEYALRTAGQSMPYGGLDWFQSEGWPIYASMRRQTTQAFLDALEDYEQKGRQTRQMFLDALSANGDDGSDSHGPTV